MTDWHDVVERAFWTAIQAFVGALSATTLIDVDGQVLLAALAAAFAALLSFLKTLALERLKMLDTRTRTRT